MPTQPTRDQVEEFIVNTLVDCGAEQEAIHVDATFHDLEIDSLDILDLGESVNKEFRIKLRPKDLEDVKTVGEILNKVCDEVGAK
ncbi:acyl carrier protein [Streptomyces sp. NPDC002159]